MKILSFYEGVTALPTLECRSCLMTCFERVDYKKGVGVLYYEENWQTLLQAADC